MMGTRPRACSTATRMISQCSSTVTVGDSPVVPTTPMHCVPSATCQSIRRRSASKSMLWSSRIGVTSATMLPVMVFIRCVLNRSILTGSLGASRDKRMARGRVAAALADRCQPLDEAVWVGEEAVFVGDDAQTRRDGQKFTVREKKLGALRPADRLVARRERLV